MSLKPDLIQPVPEETARIAKAAFRKGNPLLTLRDELGSLFSDEDFADLFPKLGQPGLAPGADHRPAVPREPDKPLRRCGSTGSTCSGWS